MRVWKVLFIAIISFSLSYCDSGHTSKKHIEVSKESLEQAIDKFNTAFQKGNTSVIKTMITDSYLHTNGNSKSIGKEDWLKYLLKREKEIKSGNLEVIGYAMKDVEIVFHDKTAIVTGKVTVSNKKGEEIQNNEYRITNIWVIEEGKWKRAGFHDGKIE